MLKVHRINHSLPLLPHWTSPHACVDLNEPCTPAGVLALNMEHTHVETKRLQAANTRRFRQLPLHTTCARVLETITGWQGWSSWLCKGSFGPQSCTAPLFARVARLQLLQHTGGRCVSCDMLVRNHTPHLDTVYCKLHKLPLLLNCTTDKGQTPQQRQTHSYQLQAHACPMLQPVLLTVSAIQSTTPDTACFNNLFASGTPLVKHC